MATLLKEAARAFWIGLAAHRPAVYWSKRTLLIPQAPVNTIISRSARRPPMR